MTGGAEGGPGAAVLLNWSLDPLCGGGKPAGGLEECGVNSVIPYHSVIL